MGTYTVIKTSTSAQYLDVEAGSEEEAIEIAMEHDDDDWETNPNDVYGPGCDYTAKLKEG